MTDCLDDLFGKPALMRGEDAARYSRLRAAVKHQIRPKNFFDELLVNEITDKIWEQQRSKDNVAALVDSAHVDAMANLLRSVLSPDLISLVDPATEMAREYYGGEATPKRMEELETKLAVLGITEEQIRAKAMEACGPAVLMFTRMGTSCEAALRSLLKESERRTSANDNTDSAASTDEHKKIKK